MVNYGLRVAPPDGYAVSIVGDVAVLSTAAETADVLSTLHWYDNDNQYGQRPSSVTVRLLADKHDGKGPQPTGRTAYALAASDYMALFAQMPVNAGGLPIAYSVQVGGNLSMYQITYDGLNVHLTHNAAGKPEYTTDVAAKVVWSDNQNAYHSRPDKVDVGVYANGKLVATYTLDQSNQTETNTWAHTFTGLPTKDGGAAITYTVAVINVPGNYLPLVNGHTVTMTNARNVSVTIRWNDHANADGKRPKEVALNLLGDGLPIGRTIPMTGGSTTETWTAAFEKVPVWDSVNTTHEIAYTYMLQAVPNTYSADYHDYQITTGQPGDSLGFTLDLTHSRELAVVNGTIHWNDGGNRDSLRPGSIVVRLWAKNGNVTTDTGLTQTANGSRTAASWTVSFAPQPVNDREGSPIVYLLKAEAPTGYTVILQDDMPAITFHHEPAQTPGGGGSGGGNTGGGSGGGNTGGGTGGGATGGSSGTDTGLTGDSRYVLAYVKGYPDGSFRPDGNITRAEVAAIVARLSADFTEGMTYGSSATDVAAQSWYTDYVNHCFATGIVKGYPDGTFKPQGAITRAEFATIVARMLDLPATDQSTFADVRGSWAESYIASLTERGIIAGYPDGSFRPDARITRAEAVTMMNRALERNPDKLNLDKLFHDTTFADARKHWAYYDILEASNDHFCGFTAE